MKRVLVIWLLILALPVQAWAAAVVAHCGTSGSHGSHAAMSSASHEHDTAHHAGGSHETDDASDSGEPMIDGTGLGGKARCSACSLCCAAGAPAPASVRIVSQPSASQTGSMTVLRFESADLPLLDRPPRTITIG